MLVRWCIVSLFYIAMCQEQVTVKKNPLLSRRKRYLLFPEGSNFVMTLSFVKAVMIQIPRLVNVLGECDVPFKLPSDPRLLRIKRNQRSEQRSQVYSQLEEALISQGLDGNSCVKRMICDAKRLLPSKGKSLVGDILSATFIYSIDEDLRENYANYCHVSNYKNCPLPLIEYIMGSLKMQS